VALVRTDVSEEPGASFIRVTKIGELGTTQAATQKTPFFIVTAVKTSNLTSLDLSIYLILPVACGPGISLASNIN
jgi:hypothetical protein